MPIERHILEETARGERAAFDALFDFAFERVYAAVARRMEKEADVQVSTAAVLERALLDLDAILALPADSADSAEAWLCAHANAVLDEIATPDAPPVRAGAEGSAR